MTEFSWRPEENRHITVEVLERLLTPEHLAWLEVQPNPVATAQARAAGAWQANDRESFAKYNRYAELRAGNAIRWEIRCNSGPHLSRRKPCGAMRKSRRRGQHGERIRSRSGRSKRSTTPCDVS